MAFQMLKTHTTSKTSKVRYFENSVDAKIRETGAMRTGLSYGLTNNVNIRNIFCVAGDF